jgi:hypothetical protein
VSEKSAVNRERPVDRAAGETRLKCGTVLLTLILRGTDLSGTVPMATCPSGTDIFGAVQSFCHLSFRYRSAGTVFLVTCPSGIALLFTDLSVTDRSGTALLEQILHVRLNFLDVNNGHSSFCVACDEFPWFPCFRDTLVIITDIRFRVKGLQ